MKQDDLGHIDIAQEGNVRIFSLVRIGTGNRITQAMAQQLTSGLEDARRDRSVSGCVLTGHGDIFCIGGDFRGAGTTSAGRLEFGRAFNDIAQAMAQLGKPLVAAINGNAHAGGFSLVTACDMAVMAEEATLGLPEIVHGLFPFLALALVKDALPKKVLFEMVYQARLLTAREAMQLHLVNELAAGPDVLKLAVERAGCTSMYNPDIISLGRDLYHNMRCMSPTEATEQSRFTLSAALKALEEYDSVSKQ